ncbi:MAG: hypothetical protein ACRCS9_11270 [Hyphomicrobium sp.]
MTLSDQWARVRGVLDLATAQVDHAHALQTAATLQVDLATYALSSLYDELSAVMAVAGRRETARVVPFTQAPLRPAREALAA